LEHTPALVHGGPFANIAHGCNSLVATKLALSHFDYVVTEAGFGADLGAEKFLDIKCKVGDFKPDAIVLVATTKALKYNGGVEKDKVKEPNLDALQNGICNLQRHIKNLGTYGTPVVVAINKFNTDTDEEINFIKSHIDVPCEICESFALGGKGALKLAEEVVRASAQPYIFTRPYNYSDNIETKISDLAKNIYGAKNVVFTEEAAKMINKITDLGYWNLPICVAKTQYSFSDNAKLLGAPKDFDFEVRDVRLSAGAGFIVLICGKIMTMPGLPAVPAAENIGLDEQHNIIGLF
jgi:formate--tetrahydrofolate ligase